MNTRRLKVQRLKKVCKMIEEGLRPTEIMKKANIHPNQYYRYRNEYCEKYSDLL